MKVKEILSQKHTYLQSASGFKLNMSTGTRDYYQTDKTLHEILYGDYSNIINTLRSFEYHSDEQKKYKQNEVPCFYVGGTLPLLKQADSYMTSFTSLLAIDIDACDNNIDIFGDLRKQIFELPYVISVLKSCSGRGLYVLILVENYKLTTNYYEYLKRLFKYKFNIVVDGQCKNIGRKRFVSMDEDIDKWVKNDDIDIEPWSLYDTGFDIIVDNSTKIKIADTKQKYKNDNEERTHAAIKKMINGGYCVEGYSAWYYLGCELANFDDGLELFKTASQNNTKYSDDDETIEKKFSQCKASGITESLHRKWQGMVKNKYGKYWYEK